MNMNFRPWSPTLRYLMLVALAILVAIGLWFTRSILEPIIAAAFISYLIHPGVNFLSNKTKLSRKASVNLVYFVSLALLIGIPSSLTPVFFDEFKRVLGDVMNLVDQLVAWLNKPNLIPGLPFDFSQLAGQISHFRETFLSRLPEQALGILGKTSMTALWLIIILVAVYYFLAEWPRLRGGFIHSFPEQYQDELNELYKRIRAIWMNYLRGQLLLMIIVGISFTIAWSVIGIPGALVLGILAGFLTLIPDVGPFLAVMTAIGVTLLEGSNWSWMPESNFLVALIALAVYFLLIGIKNFWLRPFIMGRSVHLHEALVLISILVATILWGILGALLIVPLMASFLVMFDYLRRRILGMTPFPDTEQFVREMALQSGKEKITALKARITRKKKE